MNDLLSPIGPVESAGYIHGTEPEEQERLAGLNRLTNEAFIDFLQLRGTETVLEVGSGLGILAAEVADRLPNGAVLGVEFLPEQLDQVPKRANLSFTQGDAHDLPFADELFDLVYCRYVLEHLNDPIRALREMRRVLKPGGRVAVMENNDFATDFDPSCPRFDYVWRRFIDLQFEMGGDPLIGKKLFGLLLQAGFREVSLSIQPEVHWTGCPGFVPWIENMQTLIRGAASSLLEHGLAEQDELDGALSDLDGLLMRNDAAALFYWNRAAAIR